MFSETNTEIAPWIIIKANRKTVARIEAIEHLLNIIPYKPKNKAVAPHVEVDDEVGE
jgi:polyphosphate kinase 2 (PPK2 family)